MEIWKFANQGSPNLPGTFAGRLALYATSQGLTADIIEDKEKLDHSLQLKPSALFPNLNIVAALKEHDACLKEASLSGISVHQANLTLSDVAQEAAAAKVLMIVSTSEEVSGLHWVLVRDFDPVAQALCVMDPGTGLNYEASLDVFRHHYETIHPFMGVAISVRRGRVSSADL